MNQPLNPRYFALIGASGYIAPRHMRAIKDTGNLLIAAVDPHDSVGIIDSFFPNASFFTEIERFDRHLEKLRRDRISKPVEYVSICSPNYLHDAHVRLALRIRAHAICEKPLVINPWNLDLLADLENEAGTHVYTILQLRLLDHLRRLKETIESTRTDRRLDVELTYITRRGAWYDISWKGNEEKSGGLAVNIGIHLFDLVSWLFGGVSDLEVHLRQKDRLAGLLHLDRATVRWFLSVNETDLTPEQREKGVFSCRRMIIEGEPIEFTEGFTDLHSRSYEEILSGRGFRIADARPSIQMVYQIRKKDLTLKPDLVHSFLG